MKPTCRISRTATKYDGRTLLIYLDTNSEGRMR